MKRVSHLSQIAAPGGRVAAVAAEEVVAAHGEGLLALAGLGDVVGGAARRRVHQGGAPVQVDEDLQNCDRSDTDCEGEA